MNVRICHIVCYKIQSNMCLLKLHSTKYESFNSALMEACDKVN